MVSLTMARSVAATFEPEFSALSPWDDPSYSLAVA
jgi:hypothetical protein